MKFSSMSFMKAVRTGLEPATSCVTGRCSNQIELPDPISLLQILNINSFLT